MRHNVLLPLNITGSFNIQDIEDINLMSVLYRDDTPQADNYNGVIPSPRNLASYALGTNGFLFSPQAGLKISSNDLAKIIWLV